MLVCCYNFSIDNIMRLLTMKGMAHSKIIILKPSPYWNAVMLHIVCALIIKITTDANYMVPKCCNRGRNFVFRKFKNMQRHQMMAEEMPRFANQSCVWAYKSDIKLSWWWKFPFVSLDSFGSSHLVYVLFSYLIEISHQLSIGLPVHVPFNCE